MSDYSLHPFRLVYSAQRGYLSHALLHSHEAFTPLPEALVPSTVQLLLYLVSPKTTEHSLVRLILLPRAWREVLQTDPFMEALEYIGTLPTPPKRRLLRHVLPPNRQPGPWNQTAARSARFLLFPEPLIHKKCPQTLSAFLTLAADRFRELSRLPLTLQALGERADPDRVARVVMGPLVRYAFIINHTQLSLPCFEKYSIRSSRLSERGESRFLANHLVISNQALTFEGTVGGGLQHRICSPSLGEDKTHLYQPLQRLLQVCMRRALNARYGSAAAPVFGIGVADEVVCLGVMGADRNLHVIRVYHCRALTTIPQCLLFAKHMAMFMELSRRALEGETPP